MPDHEAKIKIGTSGYSFLDWIGPFYPPGIERGKMLDYYVQHFDIVEINSSYYSIPHPRIFENMIQKVPDNFEFFVKAHKSLTHERAHIISPTQDFMQALRPLSDASMLSGILLQFPYSFKYSGENLNYLKRAIDLLYGQDVIVEFRHRAWVREEVIDLLKQMGVIYCSVDEPALDNLLEPEVFRTADTGYIRFHGRNSQTWWSGGGERYDYLYNEKELGEWKRRIDKLKKETKKIYILFNNCHHGQAVKNAKMMMNILNLNIGAAQ